MAEPETTERGNSVAPRSASEEDPESAAPRELSASPVGASSRIAPTRLSGAWTAVVLATVLLVAIVIFIAENSRSVPISYLGAHGHAPVAVVALVAAVVGALLVIAVAVARLSQLRRRLRSVRGNPDEPNPPQS